MDVIGSHVTLDDLDVIPLADFPDQFPHPQPYLPTQDRLAVLRDKHEVITAQINSMRTLPVLAHLVTVPQAS